MRLRRKASAPDVAPEEAVEPTDLAVGPHDADGLDLEDDPAFADHIDLGGLLVPPPPDGIDLRLQVDEESGQVIAVLLAGEEGALELRPFAASRGGTLWKDVSRAIAADAAQHGGTSSERSGSFGTELIIQIPVTSPDGEAAIQPSRVIGVNGPRWLLRATLLGRPAMEPEGSDEWEDLIRTVVVRRGTGAMPPGEALPLVLPAGVEQD